MKSKKIDFFEIKDFPYLVLTLCVFGFLFLLGLVFLICYLAIGDFTGRAAIGGIGYVLTIIAGILFAVLLFMALRKVLWIKKHLVSLSEETYMADCRQEEGNTSFQEKKGVKTSLFTWDGPINGGEEGFYAPAEIDGEVVSLRVLFFSPFPFLTLPILKEGEQKVRLAVFDDKRTFWIAVN